jgi:hypothetical protein
VPVLLQYNLELLFVVQTVLKQVEQCREVNDHMESLIDNCLQNTHDRNLVDNVLQSVTCDATDRYEQISFTGY